jgi:YrbI family 3-deoxy-D-manno-octulosonate 8-phosphate phosphatase
MEKALKNKFKNIKLLALDFDGVLTDGYVYTNENGEEAVRCSRKDGLGIEMLKRAGIYICVISKEANPVVTKRCNKLKIDCFQKVTTGEGKKEILIRIANKQKNKQSECAFVGDDLNDLQALKWSGVAFAVADAHPLVIDIADYITKNKGGHHAVREIAELLLQSRNIDPIKLI